MAEREQRLGAGGIEAPVPHQRAPRRSAAPRRPARSSATPACPRARFGYVIGRRPPGSASPGEHVGDARRPSPAAEEGDRTAATSSPRASTTGEPALTMTTVRGLTAATRRTSSSCSPGRAMVVRSSPSVSHSSLVPTTTTADVGVAGRRDRPVRAGPRVRAARTPSRMPAEPAPSGGGDVAAAPAPRPRTRPWRHRASDASPKNSGAARQAVGRGRRARPARRRRSGPAPVSTAPNRCGPSTSGTKAPVTVTWKRSGSTPGGRGSEEAQHRLGGHVARDHGAGAVDAVAVLAREAGLAVGVRRAPVRPCGRGRRSMRVPGSCTTAGEALGPAPRAATACGSGWRLAEPPAHGAGVRGVRADDATGVARRGRAAARRRRCGTGRGRHGDLAGTAPARRGRRRSAPRLLGGSRSVARIRSMSREQVRGPGRRRSASSTSPASTAAAESVAVDVAGRASRRSGRPGRGHGVVGRRTSPTRRSRRSPTPRAGSSVRSRRLPAAVLAADLVVGAHDPPGAGLGDGRLERAEVQLAQRPVVDVDVDRHAVDLGVVGDVSA